MKTSGVGSSVVISLISLSFIVTFMVVCVARPGRELIWLIVHLVCAAQVCCAVCQKTIRHPLQPTNHPNHHVPPVSQTISSSSTCLINVLIFLQVTLIFIMFITQPPQPSQNTVLQYFEATWNLFYHSNYCLPMGIHFEDKLLWEQREIKRCKTEIPPWKLFTLKSTVANDSLLSWEMMEKNVKLEFIFYLKIMW